MGENELGRVFPSLFYGLLFEIKVGTLSAAALLSLSLWQSLETLQVPIIFITFGISSCQDFASWLGPAEPLGAALGSLEAAVQTCLIPSLVSCPVPWFGTPVFTHCHGELLITPSCTHLNPRTLGGFKLHLWCQKHLDLASCGRGSLEEPDPQDKHGSVHAGFISFLGSLSM